MTCMRAIIVDDNLVTRQQVSLLIRETIDPSAMIVESPTLEEARTLAPFITLQGHTKLETPRCVFVSAEATLSEHLPRQLEQAFDQACGVIVVQRMGDQWECPTLWQPWVVAALRHTRLGPENRGILGVAMQEIRLRAQRFQLSQATPDAGAPRRKYINPDEELDNWAVRRRQMMATNDPKFHSPQPSIAPHPRHRDMSPEELERVAHEPRAANDADIRVALLAKLTRRERQALTYVAKGFTIREMSFLMTIKWFTVNDHLKSIYRKLNVSSRAEAAVIATKGGLV